MHQMQAEWNDTFGKLNDGNTHSFLEIKAIIGSEVDKLASAAVAREETHGEKMRMI